VLLDARRVRAPHFGPWRAIELEWELSAGRAQRACAGLVALVWVVPE